jgi:hypothetical protein
MQLKDIPLKRVTFNRGDSPHPSMLIFIDEKWERFHHEVGVELSEAELAQIPKSYIESGLLTVEEVTRTVVAK